ncbi:ion channel [Phenylobacterium immobile]|uniref:ion channel n=1 Tax=Phenylobacterium immobile TaxID=21 RepID=UPI000A561FCF|nr:ion channel [Phenylobacterium immobile]
MLAELLVATAMVCATVLIHGWGLAILGRWLDDDSDAREIRWGSTQAMVFTMAMAIGIFVLHGVEIWLYAALYHAIGAVPDLRTAVYFSTSTYGAIGFGDAAIADAWRLLGSIEGINGILLIGWSTAFFVTFITKFRTEHRKRHK